MRETILNTLQQQPTLLTPDAPHSHLHRILFALPHTPHKHLLPPLLQLAHQKLNAVPYAHVSLASRQFYTEVSILWALHDLFFPPTEYTWEDVVARLDMCLIVAGAPGRTDLVHALIHHIQQTYLPPHPSYPALSPPPKRKKRKHSPCLLAPTEIPSIETPPSLSTYLRDHLHQPFILRSYLTRTGWPAVCDPSTAWKDRRYLIQTVGRGRVVPVEIGGEYTTEGWGQGIVPFDEFLERAGWDDRPSSETNSDEARPPLYLAQHSLLDQFPMLRKDILLPDYVFSAPEEDNPAGYTPPANDDALVINVWVGGDGRSSPAHTDPFYNCYAQVVGQKRIFLTPPGHSSAMYPFSSSTEPESATAHLLANTSHVPIFTPDDRPPDRDRFPRFYAEALGDSLEGVLEEGDMLVMPPGWWHAMRQEGRGWGVSFWY